MQGGGFEYLIQHKIIELKEHVESGLNEFDDVGLRKDTPLGKYRLRAIKELISEYDNQFGSNSRGFEFIHLGND